LLLTECLFLLFTSLFTESGNFLIHPSIFSSTLIPSVVCSVEVVQPKCCIYLSLTHACCNASHVPFSLIIDRDNMG